MLSAMRFSRGLKYGEVTYAMIEDEDGSKGKGEAPKEDPTMLKEFKGRALSELLKRLPPRRVKKAFEGLKARVTKCGEETSSTRDKEDGSKGKGEVPKEVSTVLKKFKDAALNELLKRLPTKQGIKAFEGLKANFGQSIKHGEATSAMMDDENGFKWKGGVSKEVLIVLKEFKDGALNKLPKRMLPKQGRDAFEGLKTEVTKQQVPALPDNAKGCEVQTGHQTSPLKMY